VVAVVLSGLLDDGTAGLVAVQACGGVSVVQDPRDAAWPDMPRNALRGDSPDHCVPIAEMPALLDRLVRAPPGRGDRCRPASLSRLASPRGTSPPR
jgi:two-component system, chemotaxis family, protein-glutamate methylesterase/glutaminase